MIEKISAFAENGDKSISGLNLTTGFPRQQKPFRQWMNYLFNWLSLKTNEIVDEVNAINNRVEPLLQPIAVGEGFFTVNDYRSPQEVAEIKGYGTWQRFAEGRTLVGYSTDEDKQETYGIMGNEFGDNEVTLTLEQMPSHRHKIKHGREDGNTENDAGTVASDTATWSGQYIPANNISAEGGDKPHNNIQPSIVVAYWLRTA